MTNPDSHGMPAEAMSFDGAQMVGAIGNALLPMAVGPVANAYQSKKNYEAQMKALKQQQQFDLMMWRLNNEYNTPLAQRDRMVAAGYNPNLFYGQGNPGNSSAPVKSPEVPSRDFSFIGNALPMVMDLATRAQMLRESQAKTDRTVAQTDLTRVQEQVAKSNPYLDQGAWNAMIDTFKSTAMIKANEATKSFYDTQLLTSGRPQDRNTLTVGQEMIMRQLDLLDQKFDLNTKDLKIKAQILNSKEFQNELLRIQTEFLKSGDITSGMIIQFLQSLMLKAM